MNPIAEITYGIRMRQLAKSEGHIGKLPDWQPADPGEVAEKVLAAMHTQGGRSVSQLCRQTHRGKTSVTNALNSLLMQGRVTRREINRARVKWYPVAEAAE